MNSPLQSGAGLRLGAVPDGGNICAAKAPPSRRAGLRPCNLTVPKGVSFDHLLKKAGQKLCAMLNRTFLCNYSFCSFIACKTKPASQNVKSVFCCAHTVSVDTTHYFIIEIIYSSAAAASAFPLLSFITKPTRDFTAFCLPFL